MIEDVGTTPRKPLTPSQRLALFERFKGICALCGGRIVAGDKWIDEHMKALGLGGSNAPSNRGIAHRACADLKTYGKTGDLAKIADAKAKKRSHLGIRPAPPRKLQGPQFSRSAKSIARMKRGPKPSLQPLTLYGE